MTYLDYLNENFRMRRTKEEKEKFREYVLEEVNGQKKYEAKVETTGDKKNENIVIGDPLSAKVVCTAHYDTPMRAPLPNIMIPRNRLVYWLYQFVPVILSLVKELEAERAKDVAFILFDNEEKGKKGSKAYVKDYKEAMQEKFLVNFDCVANGENVVFVAMEGAEKKEEYKLLQESFTPNGTYRAFFYPAKTSESNSDYKNFPCGIGCMACMQTKGGMLYTPRIHTPKDVVAKNENIEYIMDGMKNFIGGIG